jgi:secreted trypsin-like serine protease
MNISPLLPIATFFNKIKLPIFSIYLLLFVSNSIYAIDATQIKSKIINGSIANYNFTPFMVSIQVQRNGVWGHHCGGTLFEDKFILTAAHCVEGVNPTGFRVYHGSGDLQIGGSYYEVERVFKHEGYSYPTMFKNDVALLYVPNLYGYQLISLADESFMFGTYLDMQVELIGWGYINRNNENPRNLRFGILFFLPDNACRNYYINDAYYWGGEKLNSNWITNTNVCAGIQSIGAPQPCHGDSGGPLMLFDGNNYRQLGITSFGTPNDPSVGLLGCGSSGEPAVFTRVASYIPWISKTVSDFYSEPTSTPTPVTTPTPVPAQPEVQETESGGSSGSFDWLLLLGMALLFNKNYIAKGDKG